MRQLCVDREEKRVTHGHDTIQNKAREELDLNDPSHRRL